MTYSDNEEDIYMKRHQPPSSKAKMRAAPSAKYQPRPARASTDSAFSPTISWPILLAVVPTVGSFFAGSADAWSDFVMILLILYYVYKWMTG